MEQKFGAFLCGQTKEILCDTDGKTECPFIIVLNFIGAHFVFLLFLTRIEEFAKEEVDLTLSTSLEFSTPLADLSDVKTMMDSINAVPGLI